MRTVWSPIRDILQQHARLGRAVGEPTARTWGRQPERRGVLPRLDFAELPDAFVVRIDLPGVQKSDVQVRVADGNLHVEGEVPALLTERGDVQVHRSERHAGRFERVVPLPRQADADSVTAAMFDGVLTLRISKPAPDTGRVVPIE